MPKSINKQILPLFFVIAALMPFGSTMPMLSIVKDPCKPPTGTKITVSPSDCLFIIFQFFADRKKFGHSLALREVCKDFKNVIDDDQYPCFFVELNGNPHFLNYSFYCYYKNYNKTFCVKRYKNREKKKPKKSMFHHLLRKLLFLKKKPSLLEKFTTPKTSFKALPSEKIGLKLKNHEHHEIDFLQWNDNTLTDNDLKKAKFENLKFLNLCECDNFKGDDFKGTGFEQKLKVLYVTSCKNFSGNELKELKQIQQITITNCGKFDPANLLEF